MELKEQNILFFTRTMELGGTENVVLQLCEIFAKEVKKIVVCSCGGINVEKLKEMGISHYEIPDIEAKKPHIIRQAASALKEIIKKEKITVIHTHHRMAAFYVALMRLYKRCVFINTSHNTFTNRKTFTRYAFSKAHLLACGEMVKKNLVDYFNIPEEKVTVIHNAVKPFSKEVEKDALISRLHEKGNFVIGNIGRLSEQKGMEYYLKAIPLVVQRHPDTAFLIIGTGEDEEKLKEMSVGLPVTFMGYRTDIQNVMSQLDLVVLSSLWEGLPLTPIEAFSVGKAVVATGVDGTLEIVKDGGNGLLVAARDSKGLAEKIVWLMEHPEDRKQMEMNARETFNTGFSFDIFAQSYVEYYKERISL